MGKNQRKRYRKNYNSNYTILNYLRYPQTVSG
jgi:hypothetical protein